MKTDKIIFFNDLTNISEFDPSLLNIDQVLFESNELIMYDIKCNKNLNSSDSLYLVFNNLDPYIKKSGENRYLIFVSIGKNQIVLENNIELWDEIKEQIELITGDKVIKYNKCFMKIRFKTNDDLPLSKIKNIPVWVVIASSVFKENNKYYPQVLLHDCFSEYAEDVNPLVLE